MQDPLYIIKKRVDKIINHYYDAILNLYAHSHLNNKENSIQINKFIINISKNYLKLISKDEYLNCLILIQNLFLTDIPDHSFYKGKSRSFFSPQEHKAFREILLQEFDILV